MPSTPGALLLGSSTAHNWFSRQAGRKGGRIDIDDREHASHFVNFVAVKFYAPFS